MNRRLLPLLLSIPLLSPILSCVRPAPKEPLLVFAAASLTESLARVGQAWARAGHSAPSFTFDASSRLARQIESGAPADLFFSADTAWMNELARKSLLDDASRVDLLGNELVVIVPADADSTTMPTIATLADLAHARFAHIALAGESVPAGRYAREALERAGLLATLEPRFITADNVRAALGWVADGDADAGIVYATDARVEPKVRVVLTVPPEVAPQVVYPAAALRTSKSLRESRDFLRYCRGPEARRIFLEAGFRPLTTPS